MDALPEALRPGAATEPEKWLWGDRQVQPPPVPTELQPPADIVTTLNVDHPPVWGWHIWTYLVTKNIAAGAALAAPVLPALGVAAGWPRDYVPEATALVFLAVTVFLLIHDLGRPERFWHLLLKPNTKSWLVKGGWVLTGFGALAAASLVARWMKMDDVADALRWVNVPLAVMASGYSAFLFAQCRGRDLWIKRTWALGAILILKAVVLGLCFAALFPWRPDEKLAPALVRFLCISGPLCWAWIALVIAEICYERRFNLKDVTHVGSMLAALAVVLFLPIVGTPLVVAHQLFFERRWVREGQEPLIS